MVNVSGTTIKMTRGDTFRAILTLKDEDDNVYTPVTGDVIRFAMKKNYNDSTPILLKVIPNDTLELWLEPDDTKNLPQPSSYVYDIEMTYANGDVDTFIDKAKIMLTEEVY